MCAVSGVGTYSTFSLKNQRIKGLKVSTQAVQCSAMRSLRRKTPHYQQVLSLASSTAKMYVTIRRELGEALLCTLNHHSPILRAEMRLNARPRLKDHWMINTRNLGLGLYVNRMKAPDDSDPIASVYPVSFLFFSCHQPKRNLAQTNKSNGFVLLHVKTSV